jgi:hypothetical protein
MHGCFLRPACKKLKLLRNPTSLEPLTACVRSPACESGGISYHHDYKDNNFVRNLSLGINSALVEGLNGRVVSTDRFFWVMSRANASQRFCPSPRLVPVIRQTGVLSASHDGTRRSSDLAKVYG